MLASEQKSLLVALTRASERVTVSAVLNDDLAPSDFLYTYLPERFDRSRDANPRSRRYTQLGDGAHEALDADVRGLIALARTTLATHSADAPEARDAIEALAVLAKNGFAAADPGTWPFLDEWNDSDDGAAEPGHRVPLEMGEHQHAVVVFDMAAHDGMFDTAGTGIGDLRFPVLVQ